MTKNGCNYGKVVIGSFITTMSQLMHHVSCRVFWWNIKSPKWLSPPMSQIWHSVTSGFRKTKITFEREKISDHRWDSEKYNRAADGDSNKGFCRVFWIVEETLGELCEVPRCLLWRALRLHCPMYDIFCIIFFNKCLHFSFYMAEYILNRPPHICTTMFNFIS